MVFKIKQNTPGVARAPASGESASVPLSLADKPVQRMCEGVLTG